MYKLKKITATNVIGFISGIGRKKFTLDLEDYLDKSIIVVAGNNASGKSTLFSLITPTVWPTDGRRKFIVPGKEGSVIREYVGEDGSIIRTKCFYKPKKNGDGHTASCYFEKEIPGREPMELNQNGNVTGYESLLYDYFGINKDFVSFATYSSAVTSIVKMTDQERKESVSMMTPNVKRFEVAYDLLNTKYKSLKTLIRNVAQKSLSYKSEDTLKEELKRVSRDMQKYSEERESLIKKVAKLEGRLKELSGGEDVGALIDRYSSMTDDAARFDMEIMSIERELKALYEPAGIVPKKESVSFDGMDEIPAKILKLERKAASLEAAVAGYRERLSGLSSDLSANENKTSETESALYSIQAQDINSLKETRESYKRQLAELRYSKRADEFKDLSYDEAVDLSRSLVSVDRMIRSLYDSYGELMTEFIRNGVRRDPGELARIGSEADELTARREQTYRRIAEREQYRALSDILKKRPPDCAIDSCPFIANALEWNRISTELQELAEEYAEYTRKIERLAARRKDAEIRESLALGLESLRAYLDSLFPKLKKYLGIKSLDEVFASIAKSSWTKLLDMVKLKDVIAILSEKELYYQIVAQRLPEIEHAIELAKAYGTNRDLLLRQLESLTESHDILKTAFEDYKARLTEDEAALKRCRSKLELWKDIAFALDRYGKAVEKRLKTQESISENDKKIQAIRESRAKIKEKKKLIDELDDIIRGLYPKRETLRIDLDAVHRLAIESAQLDNEFTVVNIMRSLVAPGKGIRKELIGIYMEEIKEIANQLLLNTFGGKLYLDDFIITDKEFVIPYVYADSEGSDIAYASASQQSTIATAISLAILSKVISSYGVLTFDEVDAPLNPRNKSEFIYVLSKQMEIIGVSQAWIVTQSPSLYAPYDVLFIKFPGLELDSPNADVIEV